jgi:acyl carrier protein
MRSAIRTVLGETTSLSPHLEALDDTTDLYDAGMSSFELVTLVVALEKRFGIYFPQEAMCRETFSSIVSINEAVRDAGGHA